ncbi:MAG: proline racemase family protein [Armatimonadota bacterium]|nr:proline racemase family protein [Armatimonadota bacterium]
MPLAEQGFFMRRVSIIDSHTEGEPTRLVIVGGPDLGGGDLAARREAFRTRFDAFRSAVVNEPRGADHIVGALLCEPCDQTCAAGVIFFNNIGYLNMCGHGMIGLVATLAYLGRITAGEHRIETPVGIVQARLHEDGRVAVDNVPSYRYGSNVGVELDGRTIVGDIAWGGNWFFLASEHGQELDVRRLDELTHFCKRLMAALPEQGISGTAGAPIDHIELFGPPRRADADSRNFVLCPGGAYDRSPCGTGTSAKMACLYADGKLQPGQIWRQEGILGTIFEGSIRVSNGQIWPTISGAAFITGETQLIFDPHDPLRDGVRLEWDGREPGR